MKIPDLTELALRNLRESLLRNSLTTVGISVGVASLVAMLSLGIGLQQLASRRLVKSGLFDTVRGYFTPRPAQHGPRRRTQRSYSRRKPRSRRTRTAGDRTAAQCAARLILIFASFTELRYEDKPHLTMVSALPASAKSNDAFEGMQGSFFSSDTARRSDSAKIICRGIAGKNSGPWRPRNRTLPIWRNRCWAKN